MPSVEQEIRMAHGGKGEKLGGPSFQAHLKEHNLGKLVATTLLSAMDEMISHSG